MQGALSGESSQLAVCCWRGRATLNILVAKQECTQVGTWLEYWML